MKACHFRNLEPLNRRSKCEFVRRLVLLTGLVCAGVIVPFGNSANALWDVRVSEQEIKQIADASLTVMAFTVLPDITTSSLSISKASSGDPDLWQTTLGGGFTISDSFPLYLEGNVGYSRYDPKFIATEGQEQRTLPLSWNSFAVTGGIGWDFALVESKRLKLRPIFNFTFGHLTTDVNLGQAYINAEYDLDLDIIDGGSMDAYGMGGSIMLDYENYQKEYEIDLELRYTYIKLQSFGGSTDFLEGSSEHNSASLWARGRLPTGITFLKGPLRYVLETSFTMFFGPQRGALGFDHLASVGAGLEIDTGAYPIIITRTRLVGRYMFGDNVSGYSLGLAISF